MVVETRLTIHPVEATVVSENRLFFLTGGLYNTSNCFLLFFTTLTSSKQYQFYHEMKK